MPAAAASSTTTTTTTELEPEPVEPTDDMLRAGLYLRDELPGAWRVRYYDRSLQCDEPTGGPLSGWYQNGRVGEVFSIRFMRFPADSPELSSTTDTLIAYYVNCNPWDGEETRALVEFDGRVTGSTVMATTN